MSRRRRDPWLGIGFDAWTLGWEASSVMALRGMKLAAGGAAAQTEAAAMVREKVEALQALQISAMTGALGFTAPAVAAKTLSHYRRKVRANRRRLVKG